MKSSIRKFATGGAPKEVAPRTFRFIASTAERDRDGDVIEPSGWKLDAYLRNPVILLGHDYGGAPVARAARVWVEGGKLMVDVLFPSEGASEASDEAYALVSEGFMRAVSVGFRALDREPLPDGRGFRYTSVELLEISLVSVPANASALLAARLGGKGDRPLVVDGAPLTLARLAAILRKTRTPFRQDPPRYIVRAEDVVTAVKAAVSEAVRKAINAATGRLD
jgi:HK97 family phage prohead protease